MVCARRDAVLRVLAFAHHDLAATADPPPAAHRVEVDAERAGRVEHAGPGANGPRLPEGVKTTERVRRALTAPACRSATPAVGARAAPPRPAAAPSRRRRRRLLADTAPIHVAQSGSCPSSTSAAPMARADLLVQRVGDRRRQPGAPRPWPGTRRTARAGAGSPNATFDAPHVELTRSSSRSRRRMWNTCRPAVAIAPIGITSGSTTTSSRGIPWSAARSTIRLRHLEPHVRVLGDARLVVGDRHHGGAVLRHQRQHPLQALVLAGHGVDQRLALVRGEPGLQRLDDRRVDAQRDVGHRLHQADRLRQDPRLVGQRDAGVHVEHLRAGLDLGHRVGQHRREVAGRHLRGQLLAPGRVDPLADQHEGPVEPDHHLAGRRADGRSRSRGAFLRRSPPARDSARSASSSNSASRRAASPCRLRLQVVAARLRLATPFRQVLVGPDQPGPHRGHVDGLLEPVRQRCTSPRSGPTSPPPAPGCRATRSRSAQPAQAALPSTNDASDGAEVAVPGRTMLERQARDTPRRARPRSTSSGSSVWDRYTRRR